MKIIIFAVTLTFLFIACEDKLTSEELIRYKGLGIEIAEKATKELGNNLMKQMKEGGVDKALPFCNAEAISITEKIAKQNHVEIKRTSHKIRNPKNIASVEDSEILAQFVDLSERGKTVEPTVRKDKDNKIVFYSPIFTKKQCLACHGSPTKELLSRTDSIIKSYYPEDKAIGFKEGDLRGMWKITFKN